MWYLNDHKAFGVKYRRLTVREMLYILKSASAPDVPSGKKEDLFLALVQLENKYTENQRAQLLIAARAHFRSENYPVLAEEQVAAIFRAHAAPQANNEAANEQNGRSDVQMEDADPVKHEVTAGEEMDVSKAGEEGFQLGNATMADIIEGHEQEQEANDVFFDVEPELRVCDVCYEDTLLEGFPEQKITENCQHEITICSMCVAEAMESKLKNGYWANMTCPGCDSEMTPEEVQAVSRPETFEVYDRLITEKRMREHPDYRLCLNVNCGEGTIHVPGSTQPQMTCSACGFVTCFNHERPFHHGFTCAQWDQEVRLQAQHVEEEAASKKFFEKNIRICPGMKRVRGVLRPCATPLSHAGGCHHFTCSQCRHEFCWLCLANYNLIVGPNGGARMHNPGCRYRTNGMPTFALHNPELYQ